MAKILIGITGSIAAYKILELTHMLSKLEHEVKIMLSQEALNFVTPTSFTALGAEVYSDTYNSTQVMQHINLAKWPDIIVIAPLSANTLSKIAAGIGDNLITSTLLASRAPTYLVPAMNVNMWQNSIIQDNISKLKLHNYKFWGPSSGIQACGDIGAGRMIEADEILNKITHSLLAQGKSFKGLTVVITLGATKEAIDPVRYISNYSSGRMGLALAHACASSGATVHLIAGIVDVKLPNTLDKIISVSSAEEMFEASLEAAKDADIFIACAAVADYKVANYSNEKIKKHNASNISLTLIKNPDIVARIKSEYPNLYVIGFAAETNSLIEYATSKLKSKGLDLIVANDVSNGRVFASENNEVIVIDKQLTQTLISQANKNIIAHKILEVVEKRRKINSAL